MTCLYNLFFKKQTKDVLHSTPFDNENYTFNRVTEIWTPHVHVFGKHFQYLLNVLSYAVKGNFVSRFFLYVAII